MRSWYVQFLCEQRVQWLIFAGWARQSLVWRVVTLSWSLSQLLLGVITRRLLAFLTLGKVLLVRMSGEFLFPLSRNKSLKLSLGCSGGQKSIGLSP